MLIGGLLLAAALMLWASLAWAQTLPGMQSRNGVQYLSGGIGKDEADALKQAEAGYPLTLEFASSTNREADDERAPYVSGTSVNIIDARGNDVLNVRSEGPLLLVDLPKGNYTVDAQWNGVRKRKDISLTGERRQHVMFDFAAADRTGN
jgi:hypothetical protein